MTEKIKSQNTKGILLWIEDNPHNPLLKFILDESHRQKLELCVATGVMDLRRKLDEIDHSRVRGIILDVMLYGADSLEAFDHPEIKLGRGDEVGYYLIRWVLRNEEKFPDLKNKRILILSVKPTATLDDKRISDKKNMSLILKMDRSKEWQSLAIRWIAGIS